MTSSDKVLRVALAWDHLVDSPKGNSSGTLEDFDLILYDPSGKKVAVSNGVNSTLEVINYELKTPGDYRIVLQNYSLGSVSGPIDVGIAWY